MTPSDREGWLCIWHDVRSAETKATVDRSLRCLSPRKMGMPALRQPMPILPQSRVVEPRIDSTRVMLTHCTKPHFERPRSNLVLGTGGRSRRTKLCMIILPKSRIPTSLVCAERRPIQCRTRNDNKIDSGPRLLVCYYAPTQAPHYIDFK